MSKYGMWCGMLGGWRFERRETLKLLSFLFWRIGSDCLVVTNLRVRRRGKERWECCDAYLLAYMHIYPHNHALSQVARHYALGTRVCFWCRVCSLDWIHSVRLTGCWVGRSSHNSSSSSLSRWLMHTPEPLEYVSNRLAQTI
jgi:hypothetical protein